MTITSDPGQDKTARKSRSGSEKRQRNRKKDIRFLDAELQQVEAAARSMGVDVSAFIRESAVSRAATMGAARG